MEQRIQFCTSADGTRIAYSTTGEGPPLVVVSGWLASMDVASKFPQGRALGDSLGRDRLTIGFDRRGLGASQREVEDVSLGPHLSDFSAVVDHVQLKRFDLLGFADGAAVSVAYAAQNPGRVLRLVLSASFSCGQDLGAPEATRALTDLVRNNWAVARRALSNLIFPSGPTEVQRVYSGLLYDAMSAETAAKYMEFCTSSELDVRPLLPQIHAPTLVLHRRADKIVPFGAGRATAALIPDARFVALEGDSSYPYPDHEEIADLVRRFLHEGRGERISVGTAAAGLVTILFTDMEGSTGLTQRLGDAKAQEVLRTHNTSIREALRAHGGSEIKHTGDGIMASFPSASRAIACAVAIQRRLARHNQESPEAPINVRIGLNAGEPIAEESDLFGTAVQLAARVCAHAQPGQILASDVVRQLAAGKGFRFADKGEAELKGFEEPHRLYEVAWQE